MSFIKGNSSLFDRNFKKLFDLNKYRKSTTPIRTGTHDAKIFGSSLAEIALGRYVFVGGLAAAIWINYFDPGIYHELMGHASYGERYNSYHTLLPSDEAGVNSELIERELAERAVDEWLNTLKADPDN